MTEEMHPQVAAVLRQAHELQSLMDDQLHKMNTETFTAADEAKSVEVTLNGHHHLVDVYIQDGLLRLGAQAVQQRLNEAIQTATVAATSSIEADRERLDAIVAELTADGQQPS